MSHLARRSPPWLRYLHYFSVFLFFFWWPNQGCFAGKVTRLPLCTKMKWLFAFAGRGASLALKPCPALLPAACILVLLFRVGKQLWDCHLVPLRRAFVSCCASCPALTGNFEWILFTWHLNWVNWNRAATETSKAQAQFSRRDVRSSQVCERKALSGEESWEGKNNRVYNIKSILEESLNHFTSKTQCTLP